MRVPPTQPATTPVSAPPTQPATVAPTAPAVAAPKPAAPTAAATTAPAAAAASPPAACATPLAQTPAQTEGPYYRANPPQRATLVEPGMAGTKLVLTGRVQTPACAPIAGARVDIWQADDAGRYDNSGYRLRGYVLTDAEGVYRIETIVPGLYPGRTRHIHAKVIPVNRPALTTQLYFPNEAANARDGIFDQRLVMKLADDASGKVGTYDFVVVAG
jgi:protocatechuate 3,4-dioxygenase beta subunit